MFIERSRTKKKSSCGSFSKTEIKKQLTTCVITDGHLCKFLTFLSSTKTPREKFLKKKINVIAEKTLTNNAFSRGLLTKVEIL